MRLLLLITAIFFAEFTFSQSRVNPIIKSDGGIWEMPNAVEKPDPNLQYKIVIDLYTGAENPSRISPALNNVARMINLHAVGGVPAKNITVVGVSHASNTKSILTNEAYKKRYGVDNPNIELIQELTEKGVKLFVCGQSLKARGYNQNEVNPNIGLSVSALTVMTTYQLTGYAALKF